MRARAQAEGYARALPATEGRPPFLLVVDVGHVIELYAEFTRSGATNTPFPDPRSHRIRLADLEAAGHVRWLRPDFQTRGRHTQTAPDVSPAPAAEEPGEATVEPAASAGRPLAPADLEARFTARGRWRDRLPVILETLEALGRARRTAGEPPRWQGT